MWRFIKSRETERNNNKKKRDIIPIHLSAYFMRLDQLISKENSRPKGHDRREWNFASRHARNVEGASGTGDPEGFVH